MVPHSTHPVRVLIVAAVLGEGGLPPLRQQHLGADVAVTGGPPPAHRAQRHLTEGRGAAAHGEGRLVPERGGNNHDCYFHNMMM